MLQEYRELNGNNLPLVGDIVRIKINPFSIRGDPLPNDSFVEHCIVQKCKFPANKSVEFYLDTSDPVTNIIFWERYRWKLKGYSPDIGKDPQVFLELLHPGPYRLAIEKD